MLGRFPPRLRVRPKSRPANKKAAAHSDVRLTGTQVGVHNALVAALLEPSAVIVLTGAAGLGKTVVLTAALASIADPLLRVVHLDDGEYGMDESFNTLFTAARHEARWPGRPQRRMVVVADQAEMLPTGTFAYLELLTRMPGKEALVQSVIVGRPEFSDRVDDALATRFQETAPVHLALPPLSEQDAWDLFHYRIGSVYAQRSVRRMVTMLLERSDGMPGRFDQALRAAVAGGLLEGAQA